MTRRAATALGEIAFVDEGAGPTALFWPSLFMNHSMWRAQIEAIKADYRVIALDPPGQGASQTPQAPFTLDDCAIAACDVLNALSIERAFFIGNSWGGMTAIAFAAKFADRCAGVALMNTSARGSTAFDRLNYTPMLPLLRAFGFAGPLRAIALRDFVSPRRRGDGALASEIVRRLQQLDRRGAAIAAQSVLIDRKDQRSLLAKVACPALVLGGSDDRIFPPPHTHELHQGVSSSALVMLEGVGHLAPLEAPEAVSEALRRFLRDSGA